MENKELNSVKKAMRINIILFFVYGLFLLIETFDFLEMLHTKPLDYHPTYSLVNVIYYQMEMIICFLCGFSLIILVSTRQTLKTILFSNILLLVFRVCTVYYLYLYTTEEKWIPFIYKNANALSPLFRGIFIPGQLIISALSVWYAAKLLKNRDKDQRLEEEL
jgi:hypothetical protein